MKITVEATERTGAVRKDTAEVTWLSLNGTLMVERTDGTTWVLHMPPGVVVEVVSRKDPRYRK